jgi:hypothetical protein
MRTWLYVDGAQRLAVAGNARACNVSCRRCGPLLNLPSFECLWRSAGLLTHNA